MSSAPEVGSIANDKQLHDRLPLESVTAATRDCTEGLARAVALIMEGYSERPALGERAHETVTDPVTGRASLRLLPRFTEITYAELWERAGAVAAEWRQDARHPVRPGDFVAVCGFTSVDYATLDMACLRLGAVAVPLPANAPLARLEPIVAETGPRVLAASIEVLDTAVEMVLSSASKPRLVVFDHHPEVDEERERFEAAQRRLAEAGLTAVDSLAAVTGRGRSLPTVPLFQPDRDDDPMRLLLYTSGSTGTPKGAIYTETMLRRLWAGLMPTPADVPSVGINYMPMNHVVGRVNLYSTLGRGGISYFTARSDMSSLFDDMALVRPTELLLVPRICDMLQQEYQSELVRRTAEFTDREALDAAVKADLRERFVGGRVRTLVSASAPVSRELKRFVESCLELPLHDGYGSTESGVVVFDSRVQRPPVIDYKLVDVPELGYFTTDSPYPRGELLIKTESVTPGYYMRPETTAEVFDADGFYRTGDVMMETGPDQIVYLDRRNNVLKLSQGEFVAVSRLESVFVTGPLVRQIYVYGNSERAYLLAVVVPTEEALARSANHDELKRSLNESLQHVARQAGLEPYEIPRDFLVELEPFTAENGLLSDIRKNLRPQLKERYGDRLEDLYEELASGREDMLRSLREAGPGQPVFEAVRRGLVALLGCSEAELNENARFTDLGIDSLSALSFSRLLRDVFEVEVPVGLLLSPGNDLRAVADHIEAERASGARRPTFASVHGADSTEARAADLTLERFIDAGTLERADWLRRPTGQVAPRTVLLTGANGYLGRFMCLDWLERLAGTGGRLVCVLRGRDIEDAGRRLEAAFTSGDTGLLSRYRELAATHLEVLAGDIGEERLGLDPATWRRLAEDVDLILHPAALVNHVLPYDQLFGPNVLGTAELIRLALTGRMKPLAYLSTVGVAAGSDLARFDEITDIRALSPARTLGDGYATGYSTSKWAGEVLLREAHDAYGLPVTVFRSDMILAHTRHTGQLNVPDMFTRLLFSILATGIAPESFYRTDDRGGRRRAHYDGLPVDFVAQAVDALGARNTDAHRTYNVVNPHADGISLDTFVDWLMEDGHTIRRVADYDEWFTRFETALRTLPEQRRRHSLLPLLHAFAKPGEPTPGSAVPADHFTDAVRETGIGEDGAIPHLSADLITKYANDLRELGLV
ncbi:thioester reductase domain-containing protein [Streptomyces sp. NBC_00631]|uniref:carboxylic acid reductase n=1 Tax=Streptomyces sp. NBC_00631 TaxID=2975793 RepID=UPI0030E5C92C